MSARRAIIDMGTNTFHLLVAEGVGPHAKALAEYKQPVRLGQGGISAGALAADAQDRAIACLQSFVQQAAAAGVQPGQIEVFATSAVRSAHNAHAFVQCVAEEVGLQIQVIDGPQEAQYIFRGVCASGALAAHAGPCLVMDIGGGSVEFIIGQSDGAVAWLQSFEVGGQRLLDQYMQDDPIAPAQASALQAYVTQVLTPLADACAQFKPSLLVGASGTFDTLRALQYPNEGPKSDATKPWAPLSLADMLGATRHLERLSLAERRAIPGVSELRAHMIVVALLLLEATVKMTGITRLHQSSWALKEGVLFGGAA